jgi:hypothetical protein
MLKLGISEADTRGKLTAVNDSLGRQFNKGQL